MKKLFVLALAAICATMLMAQQKADTILVSSFDSIPTQVFQLPDSFQGDTSYNRVYKTPNGVMHMSGSYHVSTGNNDRSQSAIYFSSNCGEPVIICHERPQLTKKQQKEIDKQRKARQKEIDKRQKEHDKKVAKARKGQYDYEVPFYQLNGLLPQALIFNRPANTAKVKINKKHGTIKW